MAADPNVTAVGGTQFTPVYQIIMIAAEHPRACGMISAEQAVAV